VEIPIFVSEPLPAETSDVELPRALRRSSKWPWAIAFAAALTGLGGWFIGQRQSHPAPATTITRPAATSTTHTVVDAPKRDRRRAAIDPLTL
jgi:hypothetical protein